MNILLLNQFYPPDVAATGQLLADLAREFSRQGHEVHVVCSRGSYSGNREKYPRYKQIDGVHVHRVNAFGFGREKLIGRLVDYLSFYVLAVLKSFRLGRPDVCISLTTPPYIGLIASTLKKLKGTRFALWVMDVYPEIAVVCGAVKKGGLLHRLLGKLSKVLYSKADVIISLGEVMTERLIKAGAEKDKIVTVHNWAVGEHSEIKKSSVRSLRQRLNLNGEVILMYSGNIGLGHNLDAALTAIDGLHSEKGFRLLIVGSGKGRAMLERLAKKYKPANVEFRDPVMLEELGSMLAIGDIHIVSQKPGTEGLIVPSKLYGILAAGRPVLFIGPQHCEAAQIISKSRCGIILSQNNPAESKERILKLLNDSELREEMGRNARNFYVSQLGRDKSIFHICNSVTMRVNEK